MFQEITTHDLRKPLKARAATRKYAGPYRWRPTEPGKGRGFYQASKGLYMDPAGSSLDLRLEEANDHLTRSFRRPTAYWADEYGDTTLTPVIARLPHSRGFLAGWTMGAGMLGSLDGGVWEDAEDAARAAHDIAERDAERMLEDEHRRDDED